MSKTQSSEAKSETRKLQISEIINSLKNKRIQIELDESAKNWLVNEGFSSSYGARPLKRVIQKNIIDKIAHMILSDEINDEKKVLITTKDNELKFKII